MSRSVLEWNEREVFDFLRAEIPHAFQDNKSYAVETLTTDHLVLQFETGASHLRPGGTISGPAQMELADYAVYFLLLAHHGEAARLSVTTNLTCSFLRKPKAGKLSCDVKLIKHGRTLTVADVFIKGKDGKAVAHLELTYYMGVLPT